MSLRDEKMRVWLTRQSQGYLAGHVRYVGLLDEALHPLARLPRQPVDWEHASLNSEGVLEAPDVSWDVPPLFIPHFMGFYGSIRGKLIDWYELPRGGAWALAQSDWEHGYNWSTKPQFRIS